MVYRFDGVQMRVEAGGDFGGAFVHVLSRSRVVCHRLAARGWLLGADRRCCSSWISLTFTLRARIRALASACRRCAAAIASAARTTSPIVAVGVLTLDPRRQARARHRWRTAAPTGRRPSARPRVQSYPRLTTPTPTLESTTAHSHTSDPPLERIADHAHTPHQKGQTSVIPDHDFWATCRVRCGSSNDLQVIKRTVDLRRILADKSDRQRRPVPTNAR
jgi:hypothetical protein